MKKTIQTSKISCICLFAYLYGMRMKKQPLSYHLFNTIDVFRLKFLRFGNALSIILFVAFFFLYHQISAQNTYRVLKVGGKEHGNINNLTQQKAITVTQLVKDSDFVKFESTKTTATLIGTTNKKTFDMLTKNNKKKLLIKNTLIARSERYIPGVKAGDETIVTNLDIYFGKGTFAFINDTLFIVLDEKLHINENQFFVLESEKNGEKITLKFPHIGADRLVLRKEFIKNFLKPDANKVFWINKEKSEKRLVATIKPLLIDQEELRGVLKTLQILAQEDKLNQEDKMNFYQKHFLQLYGDTHFPILQEWIIKNGF